MERGLLGAIYEKKRFYKSFINLVLHGIHTGDKLYPCNLCDKDFTSNRDFTIHLRRHNGKKPYQCNICVKAFTSNRDLPIHLRTHTGEKPYQ